jgi:hypothetical protein
MIEDLGGAKQPREMGEVNTLHAKSLKLNSSNTRWK